MSKVYHKLQLSTNDLPFLRVIKRLRKGIEQHIPSETKLQTYLDSEIIHDYIDDDDNDITLNKASCSTSSDHEYTHKTTGEYDDDPNKEPHHDSPPSYYEEHWTYQSDDKWHPPPEKAPNILATINTSKMANHNPNSH